jgi:hypothetical protein
MIYRFINFKWINNIYMINPFLYTLFLVFLIMYLGVVLTVSIIFTIRAYKTKLKGLIYGSICFILVVASQTGLLLFGFNLLTERILYTLHYLFAIFFVKSIFYEERKSLFPYILTLSIIGAAILNYIVFLMMTDNSLLLYSLEISLDFSLRFFIFIWLAWASYSAYKEFKDKDIEPWIKSRFKLTALVSLIVSLYNLNRFFLPWNVSRGDPNNLISFVIFGITAVLALIISLGFVLAWITPNWFKNYINRDYEPSYKKEYSETEVIEIIKYLADFLTKKVNLKAPAIRGLFKLSLKDEFGPFKPLDQVNYEELKKLMENSLSKRLVDLNITNVEKIIEELKIELIRCQSLITMANF